MSTLRRRMMALVKSTVPVNEIWYYAPEKVTLYTSEGVLSHEFTDGKGVITFNAAVTVVGNQLRETAITNVELPSGVTSIGGYAFYSCGSLTHASLPSSVTSIDGSAFASCGSLALTSLPDGVTSIGTTAFLGCGSLALASLPSSVTSIGVSAFRYCTAIQSLTIQIATPPTLGANAFSGTAFIIYVPAESVDTYKEAPNWSAYASRIFPIS